MVYGGAVEIDEDALLAGLIVFALGVVVFGWLLVAGTRALRRVGARTASTWGRSVAVVAVSFDVVVLVVTVLAARRDLSALAMTVVRQMWVLPVAHVLAWLVGRHQLRQRPTHNLTDRSQRPALCRGAPDKGRC